MLVMSIYPGRENSTKKVDDAGSSMTMEEMLTIHDLIRVLECKLDLISSKVDKGESNAGYHSSS